jgi:hypothetical protein
MEEVDEQTGHTDNENEFASFLPVEQFVGHCAVAAASHVRQ